MQALMTILVCVLQLVEIIKIVRASTIIGCATTDFTVSKEAKHKMMFKCLIEIVLLGILLIAETVLSVCYI